ncbi:hypothetical protein GIB67_028490, partial [Kingdonia uniflora]
VGVHGIYFFKLSLIFFCSILIWFWLSRAVFQYFGFSWSVVGVSYREKLSNFSKNQIRRSETQDQKLT